MRCEIFVSAGLLIFFSPARPFAWDVSLRYLSVSSGVSRLSRRAADLFRPLSYFRTIFACFW